MQVVCLSGPIIKPESRLAATRDGMLADSIWYRILIPLVTLTKTGPCKSRAAVSAS